MTPSLLLTASGYKEGKLYSLVPTNGNGDFTATRATTATRVNSAGLVDLVPYNLVLQSQTFENATWSKFGNASGLAPVVTSNAGTAPDGTLTADRLQFNCVGTTSSDRSILVQPSIPATIGSSYTMSFYVKAFAPSEVGKQLRIALEQGGISSVITLTADYQRIIFTGVASATTINFLIETRGTFTTNTTADVLLWGAQLVEGTSARDYLRTETRLNIPRIDYSLGGCPNILLEPQRTNLALQSSSFDNASWSKTRSSITANTTTSPSGVADADTWTGDGTSGTKYVIQSASIVSGTTYSISIYAKKNTNNFIQLFGGTATFGANAWANFDLNLGVIGTVGASASASIENVGNGWYRCIIRATATVTTTGNAHVVSLITSATSPANEVNTLSTSVFIWGAQLEAGAYATSYIPTTTASVTRNADNITRNNIYTNGLITAAGGTWFVELRNNVSLIADNATLGLWLGTSNATSSSNGTLYFRQGGGASRVQIWKFTGGTGTSLFSTTTDTTKVAIKWNGTTADIFVNGVKQVSATAFAHNNMEFLNNSTGRNTFLNEMALFPTPLTDAQMSMLTSGIYPTAAAAYASLGLVSESPSCLTSTTTF